jgi:hypothetical protein
MSERAEKEAMRDSLVNLSLLLELNPKAVTNGIRQLTQQMHISREASAKLNEHWIPTTKGSRECHRML